MKSCAVCSRPYIPGITLLGEPICGVCFQWAISILRLHHASLLRRHLPNLLQK